MHAYSTSENRAPLYSLMAVPAVVIALVSDRVSDAAGWELGWLVSAPSLGAAYILVYQLVDKVLWRTRAFRMLRLVETPIVSGVYTGRLFPEYLGADELEVTLRIDQTWTRISIESQFGAPATSFSVSTSAAVSGTSKWRCSLIYTYKNDALPGVADVDMTGHQGAAELVVDLTAHSALGTYFNFRGNKGSLDLRRRNAG